MPFLVNLDRCVSTISFATNSSGCACGAYKTLFFFSEVAQPVSVLFTYPLAIAEEPNSWSNTEVHRSTLWDLFFLFLYRLHKAEVKFNGKACMLG